MITLTSSVPGNPPLVISSEDGELVVAFAPAHLHIGHPGMSVACQVAELLETVDNILCERMISAEFKRFGVTAHGWLSPKEWERRTSKRAGISRTVSWNGTYNFASSR
jgi:hypothetical protein